ncbi:MAG: OmpA family protein [Zoogloea sp.]|uniref:OmpA family protein n=1 Tax=Zoogloea sp. TaxID=49181 RepID=UPI00263A116E|nr:OmpA family protein [Zoogloea sp.]MDD3325891.1 OmpA family protein [Zoogloea sp.]
MQEDDDNQNLVLGILFGIIALVVGLVIGLSVYVTGQNRAPAPVAAVVAEEEPEIAEVGEALVKFYFESGKAELPAGAPDEIAKVIAKLNEDPSKLVLLSGYHDETGGAAVNAEVAKARAVAVKDALVAAGLAADKVKMRKPAITLGGADAAEARRVEVRVQ